MANKPNGDGSLFLNLIPLVRGGFVIAQSLLDVLIKKIDEVEKNHQSNIREETYSSIIDALEEEIEALKREAKSASGKAKIEALESVISVLLHKMENLAEQKRKSTKRARRVRVD